MSIKAKLVATVTVALLAVPMMGLTAFADEPAETSADTSAESVTVEDTTSEAEKQVTPVSPATLVGKTFTSGGYTYKITKLSYSTWSTGKATVALVKYSGSSKTAKVPATVKRSYTFSASSKDAASKHSVSFAVTEIGANAFNNSKGHKITKLTIGANVTTIGNKAFKGCTKLKKIVVKGESIMKVGSNKGSSSAKKLTKLKKKWKTCTAFKGVPRSCRVTVPKPKGLNFGYAENVRQLFGYAGFKGVVSW